MLRMKDLERAGTGILNRQVAMVVPVESGRTPFGALLLSSIVLMAAGTAEATSLSGLPGGQRAEAAADTPSVETRSLPTGLSYDDLRQAMSRLRRAETEAASPGIAPVAGEEPIGVAQIDGLVVDETATKIGRDFYDVFYSAWSPPAGATNFTIRIQEQPAPGMGTRVVLMLNDEVLFQLQLQPRYEVVQDLARQAAAYTRNKLAERQPGPVARVASTAQPLDRAPRPVAGGASNDDRLIPGARLVPIEGGVRIDFDSPILFEVGSAQLSATALKSLGSLASHLRSDVDAEVRIRILGHTDTTGPENLNLRLSERRARSAASYLNTLGIRKDRIIVEALGSGSPVATNATPEGRRLNRRIEIVVYRRDQNQEEAG